MSDQFVGEIRIFGGNFAPTGWALCDGQLTLISQNTALFSLLGTQYGGDGKSTFGLPNLQGAAPMNAGSSAGLTTRGIGETGGESSVTLIQSQLPAHRHGAACTVATGNSPSPVGNIWAEEKKSKSALPLYSDVSANPVAMSPAALSAAGGGQSHNNLAPYLVLTFIISLLGIFPARQ